MGQYLFKGTVIDGTGRSVIEKGAVLVSDNKIEKVGPQEAIEAPKSIDIIEIENGTIMPGFIEQHVHLAGLGTINTLLWYTKSMVEFTCQAIADCSALLDAGFTSVRDVGGFGHQLKGPIEQGIVRGPRIFSSGKVFSQTGGHGDLFQKLPLDFCKSNNVGGYIVDGVEACREAARLNFREGVDFLKIMTSGGVTSQGDLNTVYHYSMDEIQVFVEEAKRHGTYVATHAQGTQGIKNALLGGVKSIEHGCFLDDECLELMVKKGAWLVPTFSIVQKYMDMLDMLPEWIVPKVTATYEAHYESVRRAHEAGIKIGLGADFLSDPAICPYGENGMEFEKLTKAGLTPMEAIVAGTRTGAELMFMEDQIGTLEPGKLADLVVVAGNPLENITILGEPDKIKLVLKNGERAKDLTADNTAVNAV